MTQVFLSHSAVDAEFALKLATDLREIGIPVWKAPESILEGERWVQAITRGVTTSTHMLILMSPAAVASEWVNFEFEMALPRRMQGQIEIIPVVYQACEPPPSWAVFQYFDGLDQDYEKALVRLVKRLKQEQPTHPPQPTLPSTTINVVVQGNVSGVLTIAGGNIVYANQPITPLPNAAAPESVRRQAPPSRPLYEPETVLIPAGPFLMGSPESDKRRLDREPEQFRLDLDYDYAIGKYPVTVGQYRAFIEAGGYREGRYWTEMGQRWRGARMQPDYWAEEEWTGDDKLPIVGVSWYEAYSYTRWLAETTGRDYRLPTEAEWEKAGRGGLMIPDRKGGMKKNPNPGRTWPWGDEEPTAELCNFGGNYRGGRISPVTSHAAQAKRQPYGLYHMAGNVWEWCLSKWANPFMYPEDNEPEGDSPRVVRGGSWDNLDKVARVAFRGYGNPGEHGATSGFRVVGVAVSSYPTP